MIEDIFDLSPKVDLMDTFLAIPCYLSSRAYLSR